MEYGLQLYSVRDITPTDFEGALRQVAETYRCNRQTFLKATHPLWPPKPNESDKAIVRGAFTATFGV